MNPRTYDGDGKRVKKSNGTGPRWDPLLETDLSGARPFLGSLKVHHLTCKMIRSSAGHSMFKTCLFSRIHRSELWFAALGILSLLLAGCGSSGGGGGSTQTGDFSISTSPTTLALSAGESQTVTVSATGINNFTASISVTVSGLPSGVTAAPATFSILPGGQQEVTVSVAPATQPLSATIAFQGTSGSLSHSAQASLSVVASDFSISASPTTLTLADGGSQTVTISAAGINNFTASISVAVSGLPSGVTADPATFSILPGGQQEVTVSVAPATQPLSATIEFQGTSGSLSHSAQASLSVIAAVTGAHPPIRTRYLRTNSFYDPNSLQFAPPHFSVYDAAHKQFFISNPFLNEIDVFDATQEIETAQIPVPLAWGLDLSPYNGSLYAGTLIGDIYQIDATTLSVTTRYPSASIGPNGFMSTTAMVLSDGRLAVQGAAGGILGVDGYSTSAVWDPVTNSLDTGTNGTICGFGNQGGFAVSGDRTRILITGVDEGGGGETVCSYDPVAKVATLGAFPYPTFVREIIPTPDGKRFFLTTNLYGVGVFDAKTVQLLGDITGPNQDEIPNAASGAVISLDGNTLYLVDQSSGAVGSFDTTSLRQTGWVPSFTVDDSQSGIVIAAIDETGLIVGPIGHGVGFIDGSQMTTNPPTLISAGFASPVTGPVAGSTTISGFAYGNVTDSAALDQIYIGNIPGVFASFAASQGHENTAQVTTPPANQTGAVDLAVVLSDGGVGIAPENFSYGPTILEVVPNGATAEGGQTGAIIGYGFGSSTSSVQVTVGGQSAPVVAVFVGAPIEPYPFPTDGLQFTIPPGTAGTVADVTITAPSGSTTAAGAFHYTSAGESYSLAASLQSGIYDAGRDLYYFADQAQIQVLSKSSGSWLSPIPLPGVTSKTQLLAISESPDGSKLAVSDYGGEAIYVLDPDEPATAKGYPMSLDQDGVADSLAPGGLAVTNNGMVYFDTRDIDGTGTPLFHKLDTSLGSIIDLGLQDGLQSGGAGDQYDRVLLSPDGSKVYSSISGGVTIGFWLDTSNDQLHFAGANSFGGSQDLAVSGDGTAVDVGGQFTDSLLNAQLDVVYIDWETWFPLGVLGQKLNHDGSILFQPLTDGIDMLARNTGRLLYRIQIPVTPANNYDVLVVAEGQNTLAVITANGVSFVDLSSLPSTTQYKRRFADATHSKPGGFGRRHIVLPSERTLSDHAIYWNERPKLRHRPEQSKYSGEK
jgi:IPT/TIG domain-containing protein